MLLRHVIGSKLREAREEQNKSLKTVARAASVSFGYVSEVERGLKEPSSEVLQKMAEAVQLPMSELLLKVSQSYDLEELIQDLESTSKEYSELQSSGSLF